MRTYVIITHGIVDIGGGQLYVNSKFEFLRKNNWNVIVLSYTEGNIILKQLAGQSHNIIPELELDPVYFRRKKRNSIINDIIERVDIANEIIVESNSTTLSLWGEIISAKLKAKHIIYNINEAINSLFSFLRNILRDIFVLNCLNNDF